MLPKDSLVAFELCGEQPKIGDKQSSTSLVAGFAGVETGTVFKIRWIGNIVNTIEFLCIR